MLHEKGSLTVVVLCVHKYYSRYETGAYYLLYWQHGNFYIRTLIAIAYTLRTFDNLFGNILTVSIVMNIVS